MKTVAMLMENFLSRAKEKNLCINYLKINQSGRTLSQYSRLQKCRLPSWSLAKGFTSLGIGIAISEGYLGLEERILDFFPEYSDRVISPNVKEITIENLLTMTSGLSNPIFFESPQSRITKDWAEVFFKDSFPYKSGERWLYSNFNTYMASRALEKRVGMTLLEYMTPRFFERIGIYNPIWATCPMGHTSAANGLMLDIDELSLYTELLAGKGKLHNKRIISEAYLDKASSPLVDNSSLANEKNRIYQGYGYGLQFLVNPEGGFRSEGKFGQFAIAIPEKEIGISVLSLDDRANEIGTLLFEEIVNPLNK